MPGNQSISAIAAVFLCLLLSCTGETPQPVQLRAAPDTLSVDAARTMIVDMGFYDFHKHKAGKGIIHKYQLTADGLAVIDATTGLMWMRSGSKIHIPHAQAANMIDYLNQERFAGHSNWRLPTLEEAMSLLAAAKFENELYIDPLFDPKQVWIWTSDLYPDGSAWRVFLNEGYCGYYDAKSRSYVRAVRSLP